MPNIFQSLSGFFSGLLGNTASGIASTSGNIPNDITSWLGSIPGEIAQAIEGGFNAFFTDLWDVIIGPMEVFVGAVLIIFALVVLFKDDLMQAGAVFGLMAL